MPPWADSSKPESQQQTIDQVFPGVYREALEDVAATQVENYR